jgi:hypothetical protein
MARLKRWESILPYTRTPYLERRSDLGGHRMDTVRDPRQAYVSL